MIVRRLAAVFACTMVLGGCATTRVSLQEVRDFADQSARLGAYAELSTRFRDTYTREQPYLMPAAQAAARATDATRRAAYDDFLTVQRAVLAYLQTLGALAGAERYDLGPQLDALGAGLKTQADGKLEQRHVQAFTGLARLLARVATGEAQARSVEAMVRDGDADLQALIDAMIVLSQFYASTSDNERNTVLGVLELEIGMAPPGERLLVVLAKAHYQAKANEYRLVARRHQLAREGLATIALGHQRLREQLGHLSAAETRALIGAFARDLRQIRDSLDSPST